jgi:hypothetical protein
LEVDDEARQFVDEAIELGVLNAIDRIVITMR